MPGAGAARFLSLLPGMCGLAWCVWAVVTVINWELMCNKLPTVPEVQTSEELRGGIFLEWKGWWCLCGVLV